MKIYTKKGDSGQTSGLNGEVLPKNHPVIHLTGELDELNAHLGLIKAMLLSDNSWQFTWKSSCNFINKIQKNLMKLMSHVSDTGCEKYFINNDDVTGIEKEIDRLFENIPKQHELIIPGKNIIEAQIQIARTAARKAERNFFAVNKERPLCAQAGVYLNRLSDYLFILSQQESLINVNFINQITGL